VVVVADALDHQALAQALAQALDLALDLAHRAPS
jgi:hypothetical protein